MSNKTFLSLNKSESLGAYVKILENSNDQWESAASLAMRGKYGNAITIAIVSIEEMVKALIVQLNGRGFQFGKVKGMNRFFRSHQIRHVIGYAMFIVNVFSEEVIFFLQKFRENPNEGLDFINAVTSNNEKAHQELSEYGMGLFESMAKEFEWFSMMETFRQDGLYVDYKDHLKTPIEITENQYREINSRLEKVRRVGLGLVEALNSNDELFVAHFDSLRKQFIKDKYYDKIESGLSQLAASRDPFQALRLLFIDSKSGC